MEAEMTRFDRRSVPVSWGLPFYKDALA